MLRRHQTSRYMRDFLRRALSGQSRWSRTPTVLPQHQEYPRILSHRFRRVRGPLPQSPPRAILPIPKRCWYTRSRRPQRLTPLHDLESMPWLALHLVLTSTYRNKEKTETAEAWADLMSQQHDFGSRTFCDNSSRRHILLNPGCLGRDVVLWEPQSTVVRVVKELDALFAELTAAYQQVEAGAGPGLAGLDACCAAVADSMAERMASLIKNTLRSHANLRRVSPEQVKPPVRQKREVVWRRRPRHLVFHNGEVVDVISGW